MDKKLQRTPLKNWQKSLHNCSKIHKNEFKPPIVNIFPGKIVTFVPTKQCDTPLRNAVSRVLFNASALQRFGVI